MMLTLLPVCPISSSRMNRKSPVALKYPPHHHPGAGKERNMGEFEREAFGSPREPDLSGEDAAELEELRREAAILREQLENAVGSQSAARSSRDVHQLEARIDSLAVAQLQADGNPQGSPPATAGAARRGRPARTAAQRLRRAAGHARGRHRRRVHLGSQDAPDVLAQHRRQVVAARGRRFASTRL